MINSRMGSEGFLLPKIIDPIQPPFVYHPPVSRKRACEELAWVIREYGEDGDPVIADRIAETIFTHVSRRHLER